MEITKQNVPFDRSKCPYENTVCIIVADVTCIFSNILRISNKFNNEKQMKWSSFIQVIQAIFSHSNKHLFDFYGGKLIVFLHAMKTQLLLFASSMV